MSLAAATRVGPYEVVALLGTGGMAEVYRAKDTRLGREVAIKVISEALGGDAAFIERFEREPALSPHQSTDSASNDSARCRTQMQERRALLVIVAGVVALTPLRANAQLAGDLVPGNYGLTSGTQPPPSLIVTPWVYDSFTTVLMGPDGQVVPNPDGAGTNFLAAPALSLTIVAPWDILGGHYSAAVWMWGSAPKYDFPKLKKTGSTYGFGDMYVQPAELGWHTTYADVLAGVAVWIPTGQYTPGGNSNTGLGQWGFEFSAGTTLWFDKAHTFNFATLVLYDVYLPKPSLTVGQTTVQLQTGNILYLQGGLGYQLLGGAINIGIPYFASFKITEDTLPQGAGIILPGIQAAKSWSIGLGAELDLFWSVSDGVQFRFLQGFGGLNTTNAATFLLTYSHIFYLFGQ